MTKEFIQTLHNWAKTNFLQISFKTDNTLSVTGFEGDFLLVEPKEDILLDEDCCLVLYEEEIDLIEQNKVQYILFEFGQRFYYTKPLIFKNKFNQIGYEAHFNDFKYVGDNGCEYDNIIPFVHLGVHDEYELLNGAQLAKDWVKKSIFLKHKAVGLSDRNTLGGTLAFQTEAKKIGLKPIIGMTASVADNYDKTKDIQITYDLKLYVTSEAGWQNLFQINKAINVDYNKFIPEDLLLSHATGLIAVFPPNSCLGSLDSPKAVKSIVNKYKAAFNDVYYQIDSVEYDDDFFDLKHITNIKTYLSNYRDLIKPILINDSYYMDQEMFLIKDYLNKIDHKAYQYSEDQYFKTLDETNAKMSLLFGDNDYWLELFMEMCGNTVELADQCNFEIKTGESKLPKYEFAPDGMTNEQFYHHLIEIGFEQKVTQKELNIDLYRERIKIENDVIVPAGFIDYFLILWDVVNWCNENDVETGTGRGSVGGSLVAFLLGLTKVDPIKNDMLFERFLNPTRVLPEIFYKVKFKNGEEKKLKQGEKYKLGEIEVLSEELKESGDIKSITVIKEMRKDSMPDVDMDFESEYRNEVKAYITMHFGEAYTCSVGSYGRLKLKAGLKDFSRARGLSFEYANIITKDIDQELTYTWRDFVQYAINSKIKQQNKEEKIGLYDFMQKYPDISLCIKHCLNQARSASVHASAVVIVPRKDKQGNDVDIFDWMPMRKIDGVLVSEWEGLYVDKAGFLKEDILALKQLDKFQMIKKLIKRNHNEDIIFEDIPTDDIEVFKLFKKGYNEDVFQFGSSGLKNYSVQIKPDTLEELIAMNALYRPGPMSSNAHTDFGLIKHGKKKPEYDYGLKDITEKTHSLIIFQEQVMKSLVVLGGFSLAMAEGTRTKIKKFDHRAMAEDKEKFIKGAIERGCGAEEADKIWEKLVAFSKYGFNFSHSNMYTHMSYYSQYLKVKHPLEFWTASLNFAREEDVPKRISEMKKLKQGLTIKPPSINKSALIFDCDPETDTIYWSLAKIKGFGGEEKVAANVILKEREANGDFKDYNDFVSRFTSKVNKSHILSLIVAGAFDEVEGITREIERFDLIKRHYERLNQNIKNKDKWDQIPVQFTTSESKKNYYWIIQQRELTGYGDIDYRSVLLMHENKKVAKQLSELFVTGEKFAKSKDYEEVAIAGMVIYASERKTKKNEKYLILNIMSNNDLLFCILWPDSYAVFKDFFDNGLGKTIVISGKVKFDEWRGQRVLFTSVDSNLLEL